MGKFQSYDKAVEEIKTAILSSQYEAAKSVNEKQLTLYYAIGKYISKNSRNGYWGQGAIDAISERLSRELPGLRGFSARNLRNMRAFYEEWSIEIEDSTRNKSDTVEVLADKSAKTEGNGDLQIWQTQFPNSKSLPVEEFFQVGFSQHILIISKCKDIRERIFYIKLTAKERYTHDELRTSILRDDYHHQGTLPNNFINTLSTGEQAFRAVNAFKDEYLLDFINVEELEIRDAQDIDERVVENSIVHNVKKFILAFGKDFAFVGSQYHLEAFGEDQYIDLLFFNRELNCLVAVELKRGKLKTSYLGQLQGYLSILDGFEKKAHENPSIGLILCKDMNKSFVDYVIQDYSSPMGVATYKTSKDMSDELTKALPPVEALVKLLDEQNDEGGMQ